MKEFIEKLNEKLTYLLNNFGEHCEEWGSDKEGDCHRKSCSDCVLTHAIEIVNQLAEEYNNDSYKGKWINTAPSSRSDNIVCSECGYNSIADYPFCPNCGRRMKEGVEAKACNDGWIPCSGCKDCQHKECEHYGKI